MKTESQCKRIHELRASGIDNIEQTMVEVGDGKCVMKYWINPNNRKND